MWAEQFVALRMRVVFNHIKKYIENLPLFFLSPILLQTAIIFTRSKRKKKVLIVCSLRLSELIMFNI